jgi:hypothetical protein
MNLSSLGEAIRHAVTTFTDSDSSEDATSDRVTESIASEFKLGVVKLPGVPLQQDLRAYILALLATKALAGCRGDKNAGEYREGALRCMRAAAAELRRCGLLESDGE